MPPLHHVLPQLERACACGGEVGALISGFDWARTPLGPLASWPSSLQVMVSVCLSTRFPMAIQWGPELVQIYNDAAVDVFGRKHPEALGRPARENFPEFWQRTMVEQLIQNIRASGQPFRAENQRLPIARRGFLEESYFTFALSPLLDDSGTVQGLLNTYIETTASVLAGRRLATLRTLAERASRTGSVAEVCHSAIAALKGNPQDVRFALLYLSDEWGEAATLEGADRIRIGSPAAPRRVVLAEPAGDGPFAESIARVLRTGEAEIREDIDACPEVCAALEGATPPRRALVLPLAQSSRARAVGVLIVGLSPRLVHDDAYFTFLHVAAGQVAAALAGAYVLRQAHERAEKLAELDRAKSTFYSNISHEFRTPLTLLLSPVEELLSADNLSALQHRELETVRRNALRLLKLVDGLLDFARIESGQMEPVPVPTDLSALTRELAGAFELASARAGLELSVDCPPLSRPARVDPEMWEKIVGNLLSNALKYTREGRISVSLREVDGRARLCVTDTGIGIPPEHLPHVFERFHRVQGAGGRSIEGAGIGLALVHDLVRVQGGSTGVESEPGRGSTFTVEIPSHPVAEAGGEAPAVHGRAGSAPWVEEANRWVAGGAPSSRPSMEEPTPETPRRARILVAEDNADMREYLTELIAPHYDVEAVSDWRSALAAARQKPPDLILSDVLMPQLDGVTLLGELRRDDRTRAVPVVLLSAEAGEEAVLEGLGEGADDYVRKPFTARELLARVRTHIELARVRREAAESEMKDAFLGMASHELRNPLATVKLTVQRMQRQTEPSPAAVASRLDALGRSVARMEHLIADLLSVSAIKSGQLIVMRHHCDLVAICRLAVEEQTALSGLPIALEVPDQPIDVVADEGRILQVVGNLLSNARKYSPPDRPVRLTLTRRAGEALISVTDEGPGIPAEEVPHIFDRFHRVPGIKVQSGPRASLGLGLYICKAIMAQHDGRIWAETEVGAGSTFHAALPLEAHEATGATKREDRG